MFEYGVSKYIFQLSGALLLVVRVGKNGLVRLVNSCIFRICGQAILLGGEGESIS